MRRSLFLVKVFAADPVGKSFHRDRPVFDMGKYVRRDVFVILDDLPFGEAGLRVHDLVMVGEGQLFAVDLCRRGGHTAFLQFRPAARQPTYPLWRELPLDSRQAPRK